MPDASIHYVSDFFSEKESLCFLEHFKNNLEWHIETLKLFGIARLCPRKTAWYGDAGISYKYSNQNHIALAWTNTLKEIKNKIEHYGAASFNSVLLNWYRNGQDSMSWHQDNEPELGQNPIIASVSFGVCRNFQLQHIFSKQKIDIFLENGSMLWMGGSTQHFWKHQLPKTKKITSDRINLTFRKIIF